jgi:hypothetical protein
MQRALVVLFLCGCAGRTAVWEVKAQPSSAASADNAAEQKADALFADRLELNKAESAAAAYGEAVAQAPTATRLIKLSRAYYFLADGHYALLGKKEEMLKTYELGLDAGERALVVACPAFAQAMKDGKKVDEAVQAIDATCVPAVYWYAVNLGKWARAEGMTKILFYKDKIKAYMTRAGELDPGYFHAAPLRYIGTMYAVAPAFAGGDLKKSEEHFHKSLALAPNYLATKVLMAEALMTKKQDRVAFEKLLQEVVAADAAALPDVVPENTVEKKKAAALLAQVDDLF